jgi:hypothetical protein
VIVGGVVESEELEYGIVEENSVIFNENSVVESILCFFLFSLSAGDWDVSRQVR